MPVAGDQRNELALPDTVKFIELPLQMLPEDGLIDIFGFGLTFTTIVLVAEQPGSTEPLTIQVVVNEGLASTTADVTEDKPIAGDHKYDVAPLAVRVIELPAHMSNAPGSIEITSVPTKICLQKMVCNYVIGIQ